MFKPEIDNLSQVATKKLALLRGHPSGFFIASILAGVYVGLGAIVSNVLGAYLGQSPAVKLAQGAVFSVALLLVLFAGAELFTGNNLVMTVGALEKKLSWGNLALVWLACFLGNWVGAWITALLYDASGLLSGPMLEVSAKVATAKISLPFLPMLARGIFCNILVCLAVWCFFKLKSESAKAILIVFCILTFVLSSFEHSVANMTYLSLGLLHPETVSFGLSGYLQALGVSALGNIIGGAIFVALPYWLISRQKEQGQDGQ